MHPAPIPANDELRLKDLHAFRILDTGPEEEYNDLVELVSQICGCPLASITFIDKDRQWFKARKNIAGTEGSRRDSFCGHTILEKEILIVKDASKDQRFFDNPDVIGGLKVGFYAGAPIVSPSGHTLGAVCAIDQQPRELTGGQLSALQAIARQVGRLLELRMKNKQILDIAEKLVQAEKQIARLNMHRQEEENYQTAYALHEDIAQATAAISHYLSFAQQNKELVNDFLEKSREELKNLTQTITTLSKNITPTTYKQDNYADHIEKLLDEYRFNHHADIIASFEGNMDALSGNKGLQLYRIVQDILRLAALSQANVLTFIIRIKKEIKLVFEYNQQRTPEITQEQLLHSNIHNRVNMLEGTIQVEEKGKLLLRFPVTGHPSELKE